LGADGDGNSLQRLLPAQYGNDPLNWITGLPSPQPAGSVNDSDGDGMPDPWEIQHGLNPNLNDANLDPDQDGLTNREEYLAGTDPQDPLSLLRLDWVDWTASQITLRFQAMPGKTYSLLRRTTLDLGAWQTLTNIPIQALPKQITITDPTAGATTQRFYQLLTPAAP